MNPSANTPLTTDSAPTCAVVWCNLGTPDAPTPSALRRYLAEFLSDRRVVEIPRLLWWPLLHGVILRTRPAKSAAKYARIWGEDGSPLRVIASAQAQALAARLSERGVSVKVHLAMRYGRPGVAATLSAAMAAGAKRILILPAYPQYSASATASVFDAVYAWAGTQRVVPELRFVNQYPDHPGYIAALAGRVRAHWQQQGRGDHLLMSFHGLPQRSVRLGDPYYDQCQQTARLLAAALALDDGQWTLSFQSRFGKARWLQPYTQDSAIALAKRGIGQLDVVCPGFTADCLETLDEIGLELRAEFEGSGGQRLALVPGLNTDSAWLDALADIAQSQLGGWPCWRADNRP